MVSQKQGQGYGVLAGEPPVAYNFIPFFYFKKKERILIMAMSELQQRLLRVELSRLGFRDAKYDAELGVYIIDPTDERAPRIHENGDIHFGSEFDHLVRDEIQPAVRRVGEQFAAWERAPVAPFKDLDNYRILNEYNNIVLAARDDSALGYGHGLHFTTWEYAYNREGFLFGHYTTDYESAKEDFAVRCGLVNRYKMFSETELKLMRQGLVYLGANYPDLTTEQMTNVGKLIEKVEIIVPSIQERSPLESHDLLPEDGLEI